MVLREAGRPQKALDQLTSYELLMHDKLVVREIKGTVLTQFNPLTPVSDQDRISPYFICIMSCKQVIRIKKNVNYRITN